MGIAAGTLDRRIRFERPVADKRLDGAGSGSWQPVVTVWANVEDALPSRGERLADGINVKTRPARIRIRHRTDISSDMRVVMGDRIMQIIAEPAEIGRREALELMVEDYSPAGNGA